MSSKNTRKKKSDHVNMIQIHYNFTTKPPCCKPDCGEEHKSERKKIAFKMRNHLWETWKFNKTNNKISLYHW